MTSVANMVSRLCLTGFETKLVYKGLVVDKEALAHFFPQYHSTNSVPTSYTIHIKLRKWQHFFPFSRGRNPWTSDRPVARTLAA
jgi:hypothetical protein